MQKKTIDVNKATGACSTRVNTRQVYVVIVSTVLKSAELLLHVNPFVLNHSFLQRAPSELPLGRFSVGYRTIP